MECKKELVKFDSFDTKTIETGVSAKELLEEGASVLSVTAWADCGRCEMLNNEVLIEGVVRFCVIYKTSDGTIKQLRRSERFGINETFSGATPSSTMLASAQAHKIRCYSEAGSLMLTASVTVTGILISPWEKEMICELSSEDVRKREMNVCVNKVAMTTPLRFEAQGDTQLSLRMPEVKEILDICAYANVSEAHISAGQLIIGGQISVQTVYLSQDEYEPVVQISDKFDFSQLIDINSAQNNENAIVNLCIEDINANVSLNQDGEARNITYNALLCGYAYALEKHECTLINDAYALKGKLECKREKVKLCCTREPITCQVNQHISVRVPEGKTPIARINSVSFMPVLTSCSVSDKRAELEGNAEAAVIYLASGSGETEGFNTSVPIKLTCDSLEFEQNSSMSYQFSLTDMQAALISGNEIEIRASFTVKFIPQNNGETEIITDVEEQDEYTMPEFGIIIYNAPQTEELWDICKRFGVDEEEVRSLNPDIGENVLAGQKIYVFRKLRQ